MKTSYIEAARVIGNTPMIVLCFFFLIGVADAVARVARRGAVLRGLNPEQVQRTEARAFFLGSQKGAEEKGAAPAASSRFSAASTVPQRKREPTHPRP